MPGLAEYRDLNMELFERLRSNDPTVKTAAAEAFNQFVRMMVREEGIQRKYMPFYQVTSADLTPQVNSEANCIVCFKEPMSPGAVTVPYNTDPIQWQITGDRFLVQFCRIMTPAFAKDVSLLRTYNYDIRQVISDNAVRDIMAQEDTRFFDAVNSAVGPLGTQSPMTGQVQYTAISGGISRDSVVEALTVMPSLPAYLQAQTAVINAVTAKQLLKWGHDEVGGPNSQEILASGVMQERMLGLDWLVTIKRYLVPDNQIYLFADPRAFGKAFMLEDITMYVETKAFRVMWFSYEEIGSAIANGAAVTRHVFT